MTVVAIRTESGAVFRLKKLLRWWSTRFGSGRLRPERQLRLCETLPLGEKRFLAVVEFKQEKLLIGGTSHSLVLLAPRVESAATGVIENRGEAWNSWNV